MSKSFYKNQNNTLKLKPYIELNTYLIEDSS